MTRELRCGLLLHLTTAAGQLNGVMPRVEADRCCVDVLQQHDAVQAALEQVSEKIMRECFERCVSDAVSGCDAVG